MKNITPILVLLIFTQICLGQNLISFEITQLLLPGGNFSKYQFDGDVLSVTENGKKQGRINLNKEEINRLGTAFNSVRIDTLNDFYSKPILDGISHTFSFNYDGYKKVIKLENYYIENLDRFLVAVNDLLKKKKQFISLGENMSYRPDTLIYYLPDFYVNNFNIPNQYELYRIMCFKKGYFITKILDSINLCDCRIYPTHKNGQFKKRNYWRAYRLQDNSWRREYFDNEKQIFKTEYIKDLIPYQIVQEKVYNEIGTKPSVKIYRYFRTEIKKE